MPSSPAPGIAGGSCHFFAVGGVFQKFLRWIQGSVSLPIVVPAPQVRFIYRGQARSITMAAIPVCRGPYTLDNLQGTGRFLGNLARRTDPTSASAPILAEPCLRHLQRRGSPVRLAGHSHRRIAAVVLDPDMTMRFGAVRLLAFELLLPPTRFSTRFVCASELIAFVDLVWGPGIFISNHLGGSPFGSRGCRDERRCARHVFLQIRSACCSPDWQTAVRFKSDHCDFQI